MYNSKSFFYFNLIIFSCLTACQNVENTELVQNQLLAQKEETILLANFQQNITATKAAAQQKIAQSSLAAQLARLPAPAVQKILIAQPDSALVAKIDTTAIQIVLVENAALLMAVRSYEESRKKIINLAAQMEGFISAEAEKYSETKVENTFDLHVPTAQFQNTIQQLRDLAMILKEKQTWKEDLTVNWAEIQTRLDAKKTAELRLKELLKTGKSDEIILIQRQLDLLYEDIQTLNRSAKIIRDKGVFSQIKICFYQELNKPAEAQADFSDKLGKNLQSGWANFKNLVLAAAAYWILIIGGFVLLIIYGLARRSSQKQARAHQQQLWQQQQQWLQQTKKNQN